MLHLRLTLALLFAVAASSASAEFPVVELHSLSQPVAQQATQFRLTPVGNHTQELDHLLFSASGITAAPVTQAEFPLSEIQLPTGEFQVNVDPQATAGLVDVRAGGRFGMSNPRRLLVTESQVLAGAVDNSQPALAQPLLPGKIYWQTFQPQALRYFRISLKAGQRFRAAAYARQIDSRAIPAMVLIDAAQAEQARSRGKRSWPAEIDFVAEASGEFELAVYDFLYRGGTDYAYLLEVSTTEPGQEPQQLELDRLLRDVMPLRETRANSTVQPQQDALATTPYQEDSPSLLELPFETQGVLGSSPTCCDFMASKSQALVFDLHSSQLGQLTDPNLVVYRVTEDSESAGLKLQQLAAQDDAPAWGGRTPRDVYLSWTAPEDGRYRVVIHDQEGGRRPADSRGYHLHVRSPQPGFDVQAAWRYPNENQALNRQVGNQLMRGGHLAIAIQVFRRDGHNAPINVTAYDLPEGITAQPTIIPAGRSDATLILAASEQCTAWQGAIKIRGTSSVGDNTLVVEAMPRCVVWAGIPTDNALRTRPTGELWTRVNATDMAPLAIAPASGDVLEATAGETIDIPIELTRRSGGAASCLLRGKDLPPKCTLGDITIAADKSQAVAKLNIAADAPPGEYTFWMLGETKVKWRPNPQSLTRLETHLATLQQRLKEAPTPQKAEIAAAIENLTPRIAASTKATAEQELTVWLPSSPVRIHIIQKP